VQQLEKDIILLTATAIRKLRECFWAPLSGMGRFPFMWCASWHEAGGRGDGDPKSVTLLQQQRVALNPSRGKHKKTLGKERLPA
jgi:hypothetical protein